jgi:hypothetical protein
MIGLPQLPKRVLKIPNYQYLSHFMNNKLITLSRNMAVISALSLIVAWSTASLVYADDSASLFGSNASSNVSQDSSVTPSPSTNPNQDSPAVTDSSPSTNPNQDNPGLFGNSPSTNPNQDNPAPEAPPVTPTTPETPTTPSGGGSTSSGGSFSGGGSSGSRVGIPLALASATTSCPLITSYMKLGGDNDGSQVAKLQIFLKNSQNLDVNVTGIFDEKTDIAVKAFQVKYLVDIMGPWDATQGSGFVYITTEKKINEIACNSPLTLSPADMVIINAYKDAQANGQNGNSVGPIIPGSVNASGTPLIGENGVVGNGGNTASVVNASVLQRLWNFIKSLF